MHFRTNNNHYLKYGLVTLLCCVLGACATRPSSPVTVSGKVFEENTLAQKRSLKGTEQTALRAITAFKDFLSENNIDRGAIAVSFNGELLGSHGVNRLITEAVPVASLSKAITAVCAEHVLSSTGQSLDATLGALFAEYFPTLPTTDKRFKNITVQQLITHTSGIRGKSVIHDAYRSKNIRKEDNEWIFRRVATRPLASTPGTKYFYDNANYAILGLIISTLSNEPYSLYCNENILKPAGIDSAEMYQQWLIKTSFGGSFRWKSNVQNVSYGAFFAVFGNGYSVVVNFSRDSGDGRREALDTALYNAFH